MGCTQEGTLFPAAVNMAILASCLVLIDTSQEIQTPRKWTCQLLARRTPGRRPNYAPKKWSIFILIIWAYGSTDIDRMLANV